jgi:hypothetical protein
MLATWDMLEPVPQNWLACEIVPDRLNLAPMSDPSSEQPGNNPYRARGSGNGLGWPKGVSGNPGGRPKGIEALARAHTSEALAVLVGALTDSDRRVAVSAAGLLLAYGWGRPKQAVTTEDSASLTFQHLIAARAFSVELAAERAATEQHTTINGEATPLSDEQESAPRSLFEPALE